MSNFFIFFSFFSFFLFFFYFFKFFFIFFGSTGQPSRRSGRCKKKTLTELINAMCNQHPCSSLATRQSQNNLLFISSYHNCKIKFLVRYVWNDVKYWHQKQTIQSIAQNLLNFSEGKHDISRGNPLLTLVPTFRNIFILKVLLLFQQR